MKKVIIIIVVIFAAIQFFTIDKENPSADMKKDFLTVMNPSSEIETIIKSSCYDCHSYHTKYPWYSNVAPVSWLLKQHVNEGRDHLNFSIWDGYNKSKKENKLDECIEMIQSDEMPMKGYVILHDEADLTDVQKQDLIDWFQSIKTK